MVGGPPTMARKIVSYWVVKVCAIEINTATFPVPHSSSRKKALQVI